MNTSIQNVGKIISDAQELITTLRGINQYGDRSQVIDTLIRDLDNKIEKALVQHTELLTKAQENLNQRKVIFRKCRSALQELIGCNSVSDEDQMVKTKRLDRKLVQRFGKDLVNAVVVVDGHVHTKRLCLHFYPSISDASDYHVSVGFADVYHHQDSTQIWSYIDLMIGATDGSVVARFMNLHTVNEISENNFTVKRVDSVLEHLVFVDDCWEDVLKLVGI